MSIVLVSSPHGSGAIHLRWPAIACLLVIAAARPAGTGETGALIVDVVSGKSPAEGADGAAIPFQRITDALDHARRTRAGFATIAVRPGLYVREALPLRLDFPLALVGSTVLELDGRQLPLRIVPSTATVVQSVPPLGRGDATMRIGSDGVRISGLVIDGGRADLGAPAIGIFVDGSLSPAKAIRGIEITRNWIIRTGSGILTRLASGAIEGNLLGILPGANERQEGDILFGVGSQVGAMIFGGLPEHPAEILFARNRASTNMSYGAIFDGDPGRLQFPRLERSLPGVLHARILDNDISGNTTSGLGLHLRGFGFAYSDVDQPAFLVAEVSGNSLEGNGTYGLSLQAPQGTFAPGAARCPPVAAAMKVHVQGNRFRDNEVGAAIATFTVQTRSLWNDRGCYVRDSAIEIDDADGELSEMDYDAPACDPDGPPAGCAGAPGCCLPLQNKLTRNAKPIEGRKLAVHPR